jgi:signal transduction histidine kinase
MFRSEAEKTRENERQRIAAEFHDGPLQNFVGLQMRLQVVRKILERSPSAGTEELRQVEDLVRNQSNEMRAFVRSMRALEVDGAGLIGSLRRMLDSFERDSGIAVTFTGGDVKTGADADTSREMLQVVREALHNVQKHARATRVAVTAARNSDQLMISVEDDGIGFPFSGRYTLEELESLRLGPLSIRRRVRGLGGSLELESWPGRGSVLRVRIAS